MKIYIIVLIFTVFLNVNIFAKQHEKYSYNSSHSSQELSLNDVIRLVLQANRSIISSSYYIDTTELSLIRARSEFEWKFAPALSADVMDGNQYTTAGLTVRRKAIFGGVLSITPQMEYGFSKENDDSIGRGVSINLTVPLLQGAGKQANLSDIYIAEYEQRAAQLSSYIVQQNVVLDAIGSVYEIIKQKKKIALFGDQIARFQHHAVLAATKKNVGLASPIDVYRAEINIKEAQSSLSAAKEAWRNATDYLQILLAVPLNTPNSISVTAPFDLNPMDISLEEAIDTALSKRIELKQAQEKTAEAERLSSIKQKNIHPRLDLNVSYTQQRYDETNDLMSEDSNYFSIGLSGSTDWSRTAAKAAYQQSRLAVRQAKLSHLAQIETIKKEVRQEYTTLLNAWDQIHIREEQIEKAGNKLDLAKIKFNHGMADNFDIIESETEMQQANINLLSSQTTYVVGIYRLRAAIGTLIDY